MNNTLDTQQLRAIFYLEARVQYAQDALLGTVQAVDGHELTIIWDNDIVSRTEVTRIGLDGLHLA